MDPKQPHLERKLATILSADVAEYSRLMAEDEEGTLRTFAKHREVFESLVTMHRGRIFNTAGDAILAEFASAVEAVRCATEIQAALRTMNDKLPAKRQVQFRIGVNLGDVLPRGTDLLGDGVNVAARLQSAAEPGGICLSGSVYDQIRNKLSLTVSSLGEKTFKNIPQPVRTFSITETEGGRKLPSAKAEPAAAAANPWKKIAVGAVLVAVIAAGVAFRSLHRPAQTQAPLPPASAPAVPEFHTFDGVYTGTYCTPPAPSEQPKCHEVSMTVAGATIHGEWEAPRIGKITSDGELSPSGEVKIKTNWIRPNGESIPRPDLNGAIVNTVLDANGRFPNGTTGLLHLTKGTPVPAAPAPAAVTAAPAGEKYAGKFCQETLRDDVRCSDASVEVADGKVKGTWDAMNGVAKMFLDGDVNSAGEVTLQFHAEIRNGMPLGNAELKGTLKDGKLEADGKFRNGREARVRLSRAP